MHFRQNLMSAIYENTVMSTYNEPVYNELSDKTNRESFRL